jgi:lysophospholipase L1-like esterase
MRKRHLSSIRYYSVFLLLIAAVQGYSQEYERAKLWENEMKAFAETDRRQTPPREAVLFVGSSSFYRWRTIREDFPRTDLINRGFGGSRLEDVNYFAPQIVLPYKPRIIVLYAGENDIAEGATAADVLGEIKRFVGIVKKSLPNTRVLFVSIKPSPLRWSFWPEMRRANELIRTELSLEKKVRFVDVAAAMLDKNGKPKGGIYESDRLHLNGNGYAIWRDILAPLLR